MNATVTTQKNVTITYYSGFEFASVHCPRTGAIIHKSFGTYAEAISEAISWASGMALRVTDINIER